MVIKPDGTKATARELRLDCSFCRSISIRILNRNRYCFCVAAHGKGKKTLHLQKGGLRLKIAESQANTAPKQPHPDAAAGRQVIGEFHRPRRPRAQDAIHAMHKHMHTSRSTASALALPPLELQPEIGAHRAATGCIAGGRAIRENAGFRTQPKSTVFKEPLSYFANGGIFLVCLR